MSQRSLSSRENKEQRQKISSSSPLEKENAVQTAVKAKAKRGDKRMVNEIWEEPEKEKQNKLKLKREQNEGSKNEKVSRERKTHSGIPNTEKCETVPKNHRNDIVVQKIHTQILRNNGTPTHVTEKSSRMEMERKTRTGFGEN